MTINYVLPTIWCQLGICYNSPTHISLKQPQNILNFFIQEPKASDIFEAKLFQV